MGMWIYDDMMEMEDFRLYRKEVRKLEKEYLRTRILLRDGESDLRIDPHNEDLRAKVKSLKEKLKHMESQGPRFASDHPLESPFGRPHTDRLPKGLARQRLIIEDAGNACAIGTVDLTFTP